MRWLLKPITLRSCVFFRLDKKYFREKQFCIFLLVCLLFFLSIDQVRAAGVTIITHGWSTEKDYITWPLHMRRAIIQHHLINEWKDGEIKIAEPSNFFWWGDKLVPDIVDWPSNIEESSTGEIVIVLNWSSISNHFIPENPYNTKHVAEAVKDLILKGQNGNKPLAELPIHLIGHSRGGTLVTELARVLGEAGVWVDHVTMLDPHGVNLSRIPAVKDPDPLIYENVVFADNYYQGNLNTWPDGCWVTGAYNRYLETSVLDDAGYEAQICFPPFCMSKNHSDVPLWYHGTIETDGYTWDGTKEITSETTSSMRNTWWKSKSDEGGYENYGKGTGFRFSRIASEKYGDIRNKDFEPVVGLEKVKSGYSNLFVGGEGARSSIENKSGATWPNIIEMKLFDESGAEFTNNVPILTIGDSFEIKFWFSSYKKSWKAEFYLDDDRNPYNGLGRRLVNGQTDSNSRAGNPELWFWDYFKAVTPSVTPNTYYICGVITAGNETYGYKKRYFYASKAVIIRQPSNAFNAPSVSPVEGGTGDTFTYRVTYSDISGVSPLEKIIYVDGVPHSMTLESGTQSNRTYKYSKSDLSVGVHNYRFSFKTGDGMIVESETYSGPDVSSSSSNTIPNFSIRAKTLESGEEIYENIWQQDNDPYFFWERPKSTYPITGYSYSIDETPSNLVQLAKEYYQVPRDDLSNGLHYFRIKAQNNMGTWGATQTFKLKVDNESPEFTSEMIINDGDLETTSTIVTLSNIDAEDEWSGLYQISLKNGDGSWSPWEIYSTLRTGWDLTAYGGDNEYGVKTVYVRCRDKAGNVSVSKSASINYVPLIPMIDVKVENQHGVAAWDFGEVSLNARWETPSYTEKTFTLANNGRAYLNVSRVSVDSDAFTVTPVNGSESLDDWVIPPGTTKFFKVIFTPTAVGVESGSLTLNSNDPAHPTWVISLSGVGLESAIRVTALKLENKTFDFGTIDVGNTASHTFTVFNDGNRNLEIQEARFWGDKTSFSVEPKNTWESSLDDWIIPPGGSKEFILLFSPKIASDNITIFELLTNDPDWNDQMFSISLTGKGRGGITPVDLKAITTEGANRNFQIYNSLAFISGTLGLQIADISNPQDPVVLSNYDSISSVNKVCIEGSYVYMAEVDGTVEIVNISNPAQPTYVSHIKVGTNARGIVYLNDGRTESWRPKRLYVACNTDGLKVIDVTEPSNPAILGGYPVRSGESVMDVVLSGTGVNGWAENCLAVIMGDAIYLGHMINPDVFSGYSVFYLSNPMGLYSESNRLYIGDDYGLYIYDVADVNNPRFLGKVPQDPALTLPVFFISYSNSLAYMSQFNIGVMIIDVKNPEQPSVLGTYVDKNAMGVIGYQSLLYVAASDSKWHVVDPQVFSDLVPSGKDEQTYTVRPGSSFKATSIISNLGSVSITANSGIKLKAYLSKDAILNNDAILLSPALSIVDVIGGYSSVEKTWDLNVGSNVTSRTYHLIYELTIPSSVYDHQTNNDIWISLSSVVTVDDTTPSIKSLTLDQPSDSGLQGDNITNSSMVTIEGETKPGTTLVLMRGSESLRSCVSEADGKIRFNNVWLEDGVNTFVVKAIDLAGNGAELTYNVHLDTQIPLLKFDLSPLSDGGKIGDYLTKYQVISIVGETEPGAKVALVSGGQQIGITMASVSGTFEFFNILLQENVNKIVVDATDAAGNYVSVNHYITVDNDKPPAPSMPVWTNAFVFEGTVTEHGIVRLYADGVEVGSQAIIDDVRKYSIMIEPPTRGISMVFAKLEDTAGNLSDSSASWLSNSSSLPGDISADLCVDLKDAILGLKLICREHAEEVNIKADTNDDDKIGLQDVIYIMQKTAGPRSTSLQ